LEQQVAIEEERAGVSDPNHFAYPPIAKAARTRSENLRQSVETLNGQKEQADAQLAAAKEALDGAQHAHERRLEGAVGRSAFELRSAS
ncbi:MAG: flagellar export protein FliJ, partial [Pseudomonadota bacterium]